MTPCQREMAESTDDDTDCTASEELALCLAAVASCQPETDSSSAMSTSSDDFGDEPVSRIIAGVYTYQSTGVSLKISPSYVQDNSWTKEKLLGTGAFSSAFVAVDKATGYRMAVKQLAYVRNTAEAEEQSLQVIAKEVNLMQKLGPHAHIVSCCDVLNIALMLLFRSILWAQSKRAIMSMCSSNTWLGVACQAILLPTGL